MITLIGFTGRANSGKDAAADALVKNHNFKARPFAYPMKEACKAIFGWDDSILYGQDKEEVDTFFGVSPREALQTLGTEWGRNMINKDLWLKSMEKFIRSNKLVVVPDVRMDNEAELIRSMGGVVIEVARPAIKNVREHASEKGINRDLIDATLYNTGTLESLGRAATAILDL